MRKNVEGEKEKLGKREFYPNKAAFVSEELRDHGVEIAFGVHGGDLWSIIDPMSRDGIRLITVHHEQTAVYAAEAYSKVTGKVGVFYADTGPGAANAASAIQQAYLSCSPLVGIVGGSMPGQEKYYGLQPNFSTEMFKPITKWTVRIENEYAVKHYISKAFKDAHTYPKGPCVLELPLTSYVGYPSPQSYVNTIAGLPYQEKWRGDETGKPIPESGGDPILVEKMIKKLWEAKNPVVFAGDGVHWSRASQKLIEFAELARIPVCGRRIGRGAIPEVHPLHFSSHIHRKVLADCDLMVTIGMKIGYFDSTFGRGWPKCIQINESPEHISHTVDSDMIVPGGPKVILNQMIEHIKANNLTPPVERGAWIEKIQLLQMDADSRLDQRATRYKDNNPIHHGWLSKVVWDTCEDLYKGMNRVIIDGYTISGFIPPMIKARYSGQVLDASEHAGVGHGIGMAIGAALGDSESKRHPVIAMMGDAGVGNSGFDIETALRYKLPIVYIITNNDGWLTGMKYYYYGKNWDAMGAQDRPQGQEFLHDIRYEKLSQVFGVHGEYVTDPGELRPALERSLRSAEKGKTAVMNVIVDPTIMNPVTHSNAYVAGFNHIPWDDLPKRGKAMRRNYYKLFPWDEAGEPELPRPDNWAPVSEEDMEP